MVRDGTSNTEDDKTNSTEESANQYITGRRFYDQNQDTNVDTNTCKKKKVENVS